MTSNFVIIDCYRLSISIILLLINWHQLSLIVIDCHRLLLIITDHLFYPHACIQIQIATAWSNLQSWSKVLGTLATITIVTICLLNRLKLLFRCSGFYSCAYGNYCERINKPFACTFCSFLWSCLSEWVVSLIVLDPVSYPEHPSPNIIIYTFLFRGLWHNLAILHVHHSRFPRHDLMISSSDFCCFWFSLEQ